MKTKFITAVLLFVMVGKFSHAQMIIKPGAFQGPYDVYTIYGQKVTSGEGDLSGIRFPESGMYILNYENTTAKITTSLDGQITSFKVVTRDHAQLDAVITQHNPTSSTIEGDPRSMTKPVVVDSVDLSSLSSDRSLQAFTYCDSISLNRRDLPDFVTSWAQLQAVLAIVPTDWQKMEIIAAWVYRTSDFKFNEALMAMGWFTWRDSMSIEDRYNYSRGDSGIVLCGNRAEQLSQILRDSFEITNQLLYSINGLHTVLLVQTSAGVWMLDPYYSSNYAEVRPMQQYGQILSEAERTYPLDFLSYLRKAKAGGSDLRLRAIPKSFGVCDNIKDTIPVLFTDCDLVSQYLNTVNPAQNPFCDTCLGSNMSVWMPNRYFLTNENSPFNLKELDTQSFLKYSQDSAFPAGVTAETFFAYTGNGITFGVYPSADPAWSQSVMVTISNILQIPFVP